MKKLKAKLASMSQKGGPAYMMHIVAGFPSLDESLAIAERLISRGVDFLEVQLPFSDPVADGPVIAAANETALSQGTRIKDGLAMIQRLSSNSETPILIMTYFNIVHHYGVEAFVESAKACGAQGLIIPDYPFDEDPRHHLLSECERQDLAFIQVVASTTREARLKQLAAHATGFIYCMARTGTTGVKTEITEATLKYLSAVRACTTLPLAVGFGLSKRSQVDQLKPYAEIMIVGSALIQAYAGKPLPAALSAVDGFLDALREAT